MESSKIQDRISNFLRQITSGGGSGGVWGRVLSQLGDPHPGAGLRADGVPDIVWCTVSAGEFQYGSDRKRDTAAADDEIPQSHVVLPLFRISKYPITHRQYQAFVDSRDGYRSPHWWDGLHEEGLQQQATGPADQEFRYDTHPRECVSWYDAMAYCRWLSTKLHVVVTLPTEQQWEKAARGTDGRIFPYGDTFDIKKCNADVSCIGLTTAVHVYPEGASPYGVMDMAGNVWEWTLTEYETRSDTHSGSAERRALRGGAWSYLPNYSRAACRLANPPTSRRSIIGFRIATPLDSADPAHSRPDHRQQAVHPARPISPGASAHGGHSAGHTTGTIPSSAGAHAEHSADPTSHAGEHEEHGAPPTSPSTEGHGGFLADAEPIDMSTHGETAMEAYPPASGGHGGFLADAEPIDLSQHNVLPADANPPDTGSHAGFLAEADPIDIHGHSSFLAEGAPADVGPHGSFLAEADPIDIRGHSTFLGDAAETGEHGTFLVDAEPIDLDEHNGPTRHP
ncbi:MAG: SUMF1/EgtB/PvdO family nonheme iron enzyme [Capsulimonadaceae bacterium]